MANMSDSGRRPGVWRQFTRFYAALLSWVVVFSVAILVVPVSLQIPASSYSGKVRSA